VYRQVRTPAGAPFEIDLDSGDVIRRGVIGG
jgi:hypothetical protein